MIRWTVIFLLTLSSAAQEERMVVGVVSEASPGRMVLVLDGDGYPGQKRGMPLTFAVISATRVLDNERPAGPGAIQPRRQAVVKYVPGRAGTLLAREIRVLGGVRARNDQANRSQPTTTTLKLAEVRLQRTSRQGDAGSEQVKAGTQFFIAFYVQVDARTPLQLEYRCMNPDFSKASKDGKKEALKSLGVCDYTETVPAGFKGLRYHAFPMKYSRGSNGQDLIVAEVAPVFRSSGGGTTRAWQRKLAPVTIQP